MVCRETSACVPATPSAEPGWTGACFAPGGASLLATARRYSRMARPLSRPAQPPRSASQASQASRPARPPDPLPAGAHPPRPPPSRAGRPVRWGHSREDGAHRGAPVRHPVHVRTRPPPRLAPHVAPPPRQMGLPPARPAGRAACGALRSAAADVRRLLPFAFLSKGPSAATASASSQSQRRARRDPSATAITPPRPPSPRPFPHYHITRPPLADPPPPSEADLRFGPACAGQRVLRPAGRRPGPRPGPRHCRHHHRRGARAFTHPALPSPGCVLHSAHPPPPSSSDWRPRPSRPSRGTSRGPGWSPPPARRGTYTYTSQGRGCP